MRVALLGFLAVCMIGLTGWGFFFASSNGGAPSGIGGTPTPTPTPGPGIFNCTSGVGTSTALSLVLTVNPNQGLVVMHKGSVSNVDPGVSDTLNPNGWISVRNSTDGCVYTNFVPATVGNGSDTVTVASPGTGLFNAATFCTFNNLASLDIVSGQPYQTGVTTALTGNVTPSVTTDTLLGFHYVEANGAATNPVFSGNSSNTTVAANVPTDFSPLLGTPNNASLLIGATYEVGQQGTTVGFQRPFTVTGGTGVGNFCGGITAISSVNVPVGSLAVAPLTASISVGTQQQIVATATLTSGQVETVTQVAAWSSDNVAVASVNATGLVTGNAQGSANIKATYGSFSATSAISVTPAGGGAPSPPTLNAPIQTFQPGAVFGGHTVAGNGTTDDTAALQAAINAGDTQINAATYLISGNITVPSNRNIRCGTGTAPAANVILKNPSTVGYTMFVMNGTTSDTVFGCTFAGVNYNVNAAPTCQANAFCEFVQLKNGASSAHIANNDFNGVCGFVGAVEFTIDSDANPVPHNNTVEWNTFEHCGLRGVEITAGNANTAQHNVSSDCAEAGEELDTGAAVTNNVMDHETVNFVFGVGEGQGCSTFTNGGGTNQLSTGYACHPTCTQNYQTDTVSNSSCGSTGPGAWLAIQGAGLAVGNRGIYTNNTVSGACVVN